MVTLYKLPPLSKISRKKRGAKIIAEIVGYGATGDAFHITLPAEGGEGGGTIVATGTPEAIYCTPLISLAPNFILGIKVNSDCCSHANSNTLHTTSTV